MGLPRYRGKQVMEGCTINECHGLCFYQATELAYLQRHVQLCACLSTMQDVRGCNAGHDAALHTFLHSLPTGDSVGIIRSPRHVFLSDGADSASHRCVGP